MFNWKLKDIIMICLFSVVFSFVYLGMVYFSEFLATLLTPFGLAPFAYEIVYGTWFMASTFVPYVVQKAGVAIVSETISALLEVLMGSIFGPIVILFGIVQGAGAEIVFAKDRYKDFSMKNMCLASLGACIASFIWGYVRGGFHKYSALYLLAMFIVRALSSVLFAGILAKKLGDKLAKTGVLSDYRLGKDNIYE